MTRTPSGPPTALRGRASRGPNAASSPPDSSTAWAKLSHGESPELQGLRDPNGTQWLNSRRARHVAQLAQSVVVAPSLGASALASNDDSLGASPASPEASTEPPFMRDPSVFTNESCISFPASAPSFTAGAATPASAPNEMPPVGEPLWSPVFAPLPRGGSGCGFRAQETPTRRPTAQKANRILRPRMRTPFHVSTIWATGDSCTTGKSALTRWPT